MKQLLFILLCSLCFISCSSRSRLEHALEFAGENRAELQKVLNHYSKNPEDSLKYKAACFLIENMPYHFSYKGDQIELFKKYYQQAKDDGYLGQDAVNQVKENAVFIDFSSLDIIRDSQVITSEYLINNIEHSFMVWQNQPWGKDISFDDFCEFILPYRIEDEPLQDWKVVYYNKYQPILDSLLTGNNIIEACSIISKHIELDPWVFILDMPTPHLGANYLFTERSGSCRDRCDLATYVMRSLGLPVGTDGVLHNPDNANKHFWSFVLDNDRSTAEFTLWEELPIANNAKSTWKKRGKVYRQTYSAQQRCLMLETFEDIIPPFNNSVKVRDVSDVYFDANTVTFDTNEIENTEEKILYLSVFDRDGWFPIDWGSVESNQMELHNIEPEVMYSLRTGKENFSIYYPFVIKGNGEKHYYIPDTINTQTLRLERKFTMRFMKEHMKRFTGGYFEASNNAEFKNAVLLHHIDSIEPAKFYTCKIEDAPKFRYVRYSSPDNSLCNMAELYFYNRNGTKLDGRVIGTEGAWNNETRLMKQAVFDGDYLTFFNAAQSQGVWVGLDFGVPQEISVIKYLPRNDENFIREGDLYELFYFDKQWISLGKQTGTDSNLLVYENGPANTVFWLRNHTRGKEERIFTYVNERQIWW